MVLVVIRTQRINTYCVLLFFGILLILVVLDRILNRLEINGKQQHTQTEVQIKIREELKTLNHNLSQSLESIERTLDSIDT